MRGPVIKINRQRGMVAVDTDEGYSIFEMLDDDTFEVGDEVSWSEHNPLGGADIINHTQGERYEVYFQNHWVSSEQLDQQLLF